MKGHLDRTKVVLRHLPPSITQAMLMEQIDTAFAGRYNWLSFRPGKSCQKHQVYSRAYINFKRPEDVIGFAEFFEGHVFVNEKGTQFKTVVEYAPSQRVPKQTSKKDGREGTILKDPEYLEFLELLAKPVENLPSAEIQLERREAERSGVVKDVPIVTPLMDYVRQKRASKGGSRRSMSNEKSSGRAGGSSGGSSSSAPSKRSSEKRRNSAAMYILRDAARSNSGKDKSTYLLRSKRDESQLSDKSIHSAVASGVEQLEEDNGAIGIAGAGKKKILLLKGKEREISHVSSGLSPEQSQVKDVISSTTVKQNQRHDVGGKIIRTILLNKDARQSQSAVQSESQAQTPHPAKDRRPPRAPSVQAVSKDTNGTMDEKVHGNGLSSFSGEKLERRARNKDRPDRGVWAPLRRLDSSQAGDLSSPATASAHSTLDSPEGFRKSVGRRGQSQGGKDFDGSGSPLPSESKSSKRGSSSGHSSHEKQVWVQKSSSGS